MVKIKKQQTKKTIRTIGNPLPLDKMPYIRKKNLKK